jgi:hypothetical protein
MSGKIETDLYLQQNSIKRGSYASDNKLIEAARVQYDPRQLSIQQDQQVGSESSDIIIFNQIISIMHEAINRRKQWKRWREGVGQLRNGCLWLMGPCVL